MSTYKIENLAHKRDMKLKWIWLKI
jgi:hypothetical protein